MRMSFSRRMALGLFGAGFAALVAGTSLTAPALAASDQQVLIDQAKNTVDTLRADPGFADFRATLGRAKAIIVVPQLVKAGFIIGGEGGSAVMMVRGAQGWSYPAFYSLGSASIGLQIGAQVSEVLLFVMTDAALEKLLTDKVTLGADISIAAGPIGVGVEAQTTTNAGSDIYAFARTKGVYGGVSLKGGALLPDQDANRAYYGSSVTAREIVLGRKSQNPGADRLRAALPPA